MKIDVQTRRVMAIFFHMFLLLLFIAGCTKERVYESIYEGMKQRERIVNPSNDPIPQEQQSYDEYKREREVFLKKDNEGKTVGIYHECKLLCYSLDSACRGNSPVFDAYCLCCCRRIPGRANMT